MPTLVISILAVVFTLFCGWTLVEKTGNSGWISLLFLIPIVNIFVWLYFVFSEWPVEQELSRYKARYGELEMENKFDDVSMDSTCLRCRAVIAAGSSACASCGWSYKGDVDGAVR